MDDTQDGVEGTPAVPRRAGDFPVKAWAGASDMVVEQVIMAEEEGGSTRIISTEGGTDRSGLVRGHEGESGTVTESVLTPDAVEGVTAPVTADEGGGHASARLGILGHDLVVAAVDLIETRSLQVSNSEIVPNLESSLLSHGTLYSILLHQFRGQEVTFIPHLSQKLPFVTSERSTSKIL